MPLPNHPVNSLGGNPLPVGVRWINRASRPLGGQQVIYNLGDGADVYEDSLPTGWNIDLLFDPPGCWLYEELYRTFRTLATPGQRLTFSWLAGITWTRNGRSHPPATVQVENYEVAFRHVDTALSFEPYSDQRIDSGLYRGEIRLLVTNALTFGAVEPISNYVGGDGLFL